MKAAHVIGPGQVCVVGSGRRLRAGQETGGAWDPRTSGSPTVASPQGTPRRVSRWAEGPAMARAM